MIESFEDTGQFWLPGDSSNKVGGTVSYSPGERPKLRLGGSFRSLHEEIQSIGQFKASTEKIILGRTSRAGRITLYECREAGGAVDIEYGGATEKHFEAFAVFRGAHFAAEEELLFREITARLSHLDEWANLFALDRDLTKYNPVTRTQAIVYRRPESIDGELDHGWKAELGLEISGPTFSQPQTDISVRTKTCFVLTPASPCTFEAAREKLQVLSSFISLTTQQPVHVLHLRGQQVAEAGSPTAGSVEIVYYIPDLQRPIKVLSPAYDMLFALAEIREDLASHLKCWERAMGSIRPVLSLYFAQLRESRTYLEHRFLSLIQAVEGYHRRRLSRPELAEGKHLTRVQEILSAVPVAYREWLEAHLERSNEPDLPKRLSDICRKYGTIMKRVSKKRSWIHTAVEIRNALVHQKEDARDFPVDEVVTISERLKLLLDLCLLTEAGFASADIDRLVDRYWRRNPPLLAIDARRMML